MSQLAITLIILLIVFVALLSGKFGYGVIGMVTIMLLMVTGVLSVSEALSGFSNTYVTILFCMMVMSAALLKTSLVEKLLGLVNKIGRTEAALITGFGLVAAAMSQFMNAFVAVACLLPLITGLCAELKISRTKIIYPIMMIALMWVFMFPVGNGAAQIAQMNGYLESFGSDIRVGMMDLTIGRLPGAILTTIFAILVVPKLCPATSTTEARDDMGRELAKSTLSKPVEILTYIICAGTVILMILSNPLGLNSTMIACVCAALLLLCGSLSEKDAFTSVNWGMIFFFAAILPLATALTNTGASDVIADFIINILGGTTNPWIISIAFIAICAVCTQFLSNTGCVQVFTPLCLMVCVKLGMNPVGVMCMVQIGATASYLTPMANPGIPLIMASGGYSLKDCLKIGILPALLICAIGVIWLSIFFPAFG